MEVHKLAEQIAKEGVLVEETVNMSGSPTPIVKVNPLIGELCNQLNADGYGDKVDSLRKRGLL